MVTPKIDRESELANAGISRPCAMYAATRLTDVSMRRWHVLRRSFSGVQALAIVSQEYRW